MNYEKIYKQFIDDRRQKEAGLWASGEYFERHHIVPKALGGIDEKENLIALTPEDHFFAHLMLAKIHGGSMWAPIAFMVGLRDRYIGSKSRKSYGWARRAMAKSTTGRNSPAYSSIVHTLVNAAGVELSGDQIYLRKKTDINRSLMSMLVHKKISVAQGWSLKGEVVKDISGKGHPMHKRETHHFVNVDGREFVGTQFDFNEKHKVGRPAISQLVSGKSILRKGWHLKGADLSYRKGINNGNAILEKHTVINKNGEVFTGIPSEIHKKIGLTRARISDLLNGKTKRTRCGWSLLK